MEAGPPLLPDAANAVVVAALVKALEGLAERGCKAPAWPLTARGEEAWLSVAVAATPAKRRRPGVAVAAGRGRPGAPAVDGAGAAETTPVLLPSEPPPLPAARTTADTVTMALDDGNDDDEDSAGMPPPAEGDDGSLAEKTATSPPKLPPPSTALTTERGELAEDDTAVVAPERPLGDAGSTGKPALS